MNSPNLDLCCRRTPRHPLGALRWRCASLAATPRRAAWLALAACLLAVPAAQAKLNVVVTTPDLAAISQAVGGDRLSLTTLTKPGEDPHFVDAKPSFIVKLNRADALIEGGAELELGWLPPLVEGARNPKLAPGAAGRIAASEGIEMLEVPATLDRSGGDLHAAGNPHFLIDPANARLAAAHLCAAFCKLDQDGSATYRAALAEFTQRLDERLVSWQAQLAPFRGHHVVAYHNLWPYFARRFGLAFDLFLEPKPGIPPTPAHLAEVIGRMKSDHVRVIVVEPFQNRKTAQTVAAATGAVVVNVTQYPGGVKGTEAGYLEMMDYLVGSLARALAGGK